MQIKSTSAPNRAPTLESAGFVIKDQSIHRVPNCPAGSDDNLSEDGASKGGSWLN
jgi:hypothetical protein